MSGTNTCAGGPNHPVVVAPSESRFFSLPPAVSLEEPAGVSPGAGYPAGFLASGVVAGLKGSGKPDLGVLAVAPEWRHRTTSAAVFTRNAFAAAPVCLNRSECDLAHLLAVVVNSGNANACTGGQGLETARAMQIVCAEELGVPAPQVAVGSTGIIGVQLDEELVTRGVRKAVATLRSDAGLGFNQSIITTDRFPKICALSVETSAGTIRLGASGKGAGMIAPALATMIVAVTTDAILAPEQLQQMLLSACERSLNRITVDGEMSTNDAVWFFASGASGIEPLGADLDLMQAALDALLLRIALMIVADGEGSTKVMRLRVSGAESEANAVSVARAVAGSPLVKTAMNGGDPNWGRIVSSAGGAMAGRSLPQAMLKLGEVVVFEHGAARPVTRAERELMTAAVRQPEVDIQLDLGLGQASTEIFFADLGHEYITINAEYHT